MTKLRLAIVEWGDAWGSNSWVSRDSLALEEKDGPSMVRTVGWIGKGTKDGVLIRATLTPTGASPLYSFVPRGMIKRITYLGAKHDIAID